MDKRLLDDIDFIIEIDKMKSILRQTKTISVDRRENDAEHSWHIAIMAMILDSYSDINIDLPKVIKMLLIHDLVELKAGDTPCYDHLANIGKQERESEAADFLFSKLSYEKEKLFRDLWDEFENMSTPESLFALAMDRLQPILMNYNNEGGTWKHFGVKRSQILDRIAPIKNISENIYEYLMYIIEDSCDKGYINED